MQESNQKCQGRNLKLCSHYYYDFHFNGAMTHTNVYLSTNVFRAPISHDISSIQSSDMLAEALQFTSQPHGEINMVPNVFSFNHMEVTCGHV